MNAASVAHRYGSLLNWVSRATIGRAAVNSVLVVEAVACCVHFD